MTIIKPKRSRRNPMNPAMPAAICCIMVLAAANVFAYGRIVDAQKGIMAGQKTLETAQTENGALKRQWYDAVGTDNLEALVKEYGFVKIAAPRYLPS